MPFKVDRSVPADRTLPNARQYEATDGTSIIVIVVTAGIYNLIDTGIAQSNLDKIDAALTIYERRPGARGLSIWRLEQSDFW